MTFKEPRLHDAIETFRTHPLAVRCEIPLEAEAMCGRVSLAFRDHLTACGIAAIRVATYFWRDDDRVKYRQDWWDVGAQDSHVFVYVPIFGVTVDWSVRQYVPTADHPAIESLTIDPARSLSRPYSLRIRFLTEDLKGVAVS